MRESFTCLECGKALMDDRLICNQCFDWFLCKILRAIRNNISQTDTFRQRLKDNYLELELGHTPIK